MASGDISKRLVSQIRSELDDNSNSIIKTDAIIYRKLSFYQRDWSKRFKCMKVVLEYDLVNDQQVYDIPDNVVSINNIKFHDSEGALLNYGDFIDDNVIITKVTKHETRQIILNNSDIFVAGMVMYADAYIQATMDDEISGSKDPVLLEDYYDYLVKAVLSEYRYLRKDLMSLDYIELRVEETANAALRIDRSTLYNFNGLVF